MNNAKSAEVIVTVADNAPTKSYLVAQKVALQTNVVNRREYVTFVDKQILPNFPSVPSWYPCEQAVAEAIIKGLK